MMFICKITKVKFAYRYVNTTMSHLLKMTLLHIRHIKDPLESLF